MPIPQTDAVTSTVAYEAWLDAQLDGAMIPTDIARKHDLMAKSAFRFLRATYWRWCEVMPEAFPELLASPEGHAVGDLHMDNFGTFRDAEGRLVWGVNDFDEAARQPLAFDLLRLAVSARLRIEASTSVDVSTWLLAGYRTGLSAPAPIVLDRDFSWLRALVHVPDNERQEFWDDLAALKPGTPPETIQAAIAGTMPDGANAITYAPRSAGGGSLGRPRWVGMAQYRGGSVVREAKRIVPSGWAYAGRATLALPEPVALASGPYRATDPFYCQPVPGLVIRRLSPNNRKIEAKSLLVDADIARVIDAMGRDLGAIHAASPGAAEAMLLHTRKPLGADQLARYTDQAVDRVVKDFKVWRTHHGAPAKGET